MSKKLWWSPLVGFATFVSLMLLAATAGATTSPTAQPDSYDVLQDSGANLLNWSANDDLSDFATLDSFDTLSLQGGAVADDGGGFFEYTAPAGYSGPDGFTYTICDNDFPTPTCDTTTVSIVVIPIETCVQGFYQVLSGQMHILDITTSPAGYIPFGDFIPDFNATGFNPVDGLIYGRGGAGDLYSFDPNSGVATLVLSGSNSGEYAGDFTNAGILVFGQGNKSTWKKFDPATGTVTPFVLSANVSSGDVAYVPATDRLYGVKGGGNTLVIIDPNTAAVTTLALTGPITATTNGFGAAWVAGGTDLFVFNNPSGNIYQIDYSTGASTLVSNSTPNGTNDGTSCAAANNPFDIQETRDFGDAPDTYGTLDANSGASAVVNSAFRLGNMSDIDTDGQPNVGADGDALDGANDDDGVLANSVSLQNQVLVSDSTVVFNVKVPLNNGFVSGWIDWNGNGVFDATEQILNDASTTTGEISFATTVPAGATLGDTYARFRLSGRSDIPATGLFSYGEVEDYRITIEDPNPEISVSKQHDLSELSTPAVPGDLVNYTIKVQNSGNVTLTDILVDDPLFTPSDITSTCTFTVDAATGLNPGEVATCMATYELTQSDIDAGGINNSATAEGKDPDDVITDDVSDSAHPEDEEGTDDDPTFAPLKRAPKLQLLKTESANLSDPSVPGDTIDFTVIVTNTGNVTVSNIVVTDAIFSPADITSSCIFAVSAAVGLAPNESATCEQTLTLTQSHIDSGNVVNFAKGSGTDPTGAEVEADGSTNTSVNNSTGLTVTKSADGLMDANGDGYPQVGEMITYSFVIENTGNVTISGITISDSIATVTGGPLSLSPGVVDSTTFAATYMLTQADLDAGYIENTAMANGQGPSGEPVSDVSDAGDEIEESPDGRGDTDGDPTNDPTLFDLSPLSQLGVTKAAVTNFEGSPVPGDTITYTVTVTNEGNVTISNIVVNDPLFLPSDITSNCDFPLDARSLTSMQSAVCTIDYEVTQADIDSGYVANSAEAIGTSPAGEKVSDVSDVSAEFEKIPDRLGFTDDDPGNHGAETKEILAKTGSASQGIIIVGLTLGLFGLAITRRGSNHGFEQR